ncbi:YsnF/AvaK domain-containing protein [Alkalihalophilus marmarensis]|uniref:YsnF/AvaK domain-containing protein n=1 Tax=Alkalihalophilus marmarensis TaxID=521377 RepID=UPI002041EDA0|nr:YsnF/AvaK domain-containing protein [Alkalihalophilus marmarensis]MCM3490703.1 YsnF/AvaK domain-containing protein [Alkalihalophilus marmarensis]
MGMFIISGAVVGGLLSLLLNITVGTGAISGAIVGGIVGTWYKKKSSAESKQVSDSQTMLLREEEMDIKKERMQTGEVKIHKEIVEDKKTITVPIRREEMVIEAGSEDELRIPLKEEEIDISKHPVQLNEVTIKKQQIEDVQHIKENVKKEMAVVETEWQADVIEKEVK